jgi:hypothetical protein
MKVPPAETISAMLEAGIVALPDVSRSTLFTAPVNDAKTQATNLRSFNSIQNLSKSSLPSASCIRKIILSPHWPDVYLC